MVDWNPGSLEGLVHEFVSVLTVRANMALVVKLYYELDRQVLGVAGHEVKCLL